MTVATSVRRLRARLPLRIQLVVLLIALSALAVTVSAVAGTTLLRNYLLDRVDRQVTLQAEQVLRGRPGPRVDRDRDGRSEIRLIYGIDVWSALLNGDGQLIADTTSELPDGVSAPRLPPLDLASAVERAGQPFTTSSTADGGQWRVAATSRNGNTVVVAQSLHDVQDTVSRLALLNAIAGLGALALLAAVSGLVVRTSLRPLRVVEDTAEAIAAGDLSRRVPEADPRTEVGSLSRSFNTMVDRFESAYRAEQASEAAARASEERMRRFVGDASHELRTPLTSIRGFAELYRQGAVPPGPELDRVLRRVEDEAARMGLLVEDLLLLARLDQHRPLRREPVDLIQIAADAVHDMSVVSPDHPVQLDVQPGDDPPTVLGDEARLRQVIGNLLANAVQHTPPGTQVRVSVGVSGAASVLEVFDDGPGMDPDVAAHVFERFYRAEASRTRGDGTAGSGLGLSIVAALVAAHDGTVDVQTQPGHGSSFTVRLPLLRTAGVVPV